MPRHTVVMLIYGIRLGVEFDVPTRHNLSHFRGNFHSQSLESLDWYWRTKLYTKITHSLPLCCMWLAVGHSTLHVDWLSATTYVSAALSLVSSIIWLIHMVCGLLAGRFHPCCGVSPDLLFSSECHKRLLNQGSFVLLCFALFAFSGFCLVFVLRIFKSSSVLYVYWKFKSSSSRNTFETTETN